MKKIFKWIIIILVIFLLLGGFYITGKYIYEYVVLPSYLSVKNVCYGVAIEEIQEEYGYTLGGTYSPSTDKIIIYSDDPKVLKHEKCHAKQQLEGRLDNCQHPIKLFFDEIECNIKMYF